MRRVLLHTHTIHGSPIGSRVICITLVSSNFFRLLSSLVFLHLVGQIDSRLCQLPAVSLKGMQRFLLLVKFILMPMAHITLMLKLNFEHVNTL